MIVTPIKIAPVTSKTDLLSLIDQNLPTIQENSIVVITSKIISICQGRVIPISETVHKEDLVREEAEHYLEASESTYNVMLTINNNMLVAWAGIDESNGNGAYILWPEKLQETTNQIWEHLKNKHTINNLGVIVTDSTLKPLRWGTTGVAMSYCGFEPLIDYRGKSDIFGRKLQYTQSSVIDGLAASAVLSMGEGNEQTPLAVISEVPFVEFVNHVPSEEELNSLKIELSQDLYAPLLEKVNWKKRK